MMSKTANGFPRGRPPLGTAANTTTQLAFRVDPAILVRLHPGWRGSAGRLTVRVDAAVREALELLEAALPEGVLHPRSAALRQALMDAADRACADPRTTRAVILRTAILEAAKRLTSEE